MSPEAPVRQVRASRGGRILRIELRRSAAPLAGVLLLLVTLGFLQLVGGPWWEGAEGWTRQWTTTAWWERFAMVFMWPVAVAAGAVHGIRERRSGTSELLATTPRPGWHRAVTASGAFALTLSAAYGLVFLYGGVRVLANGGHADLGWLPILAVGALAQVAGALLGMGVARTVPSALTPPVLALGSLTAVVAVHVTVTPDMVPNRIVLLSPALSQVYSAFLTVTWRVHAGQTVWLLGLAATGFLLLVARRPRARLLALLPVALGAAVAVPLLPADSARNYALDKAATALVCEGRVCVTKLHEPRLAALQGPGEEALRLLGRLPDPPSAVRESVDPWPRDSEVSRPSGVVPVDFDAQGLDGATKDEYLRALLAGAGTAPCLDADVSDATEEQRRAYDETKVVRELAARTVAAGWFTGELKPLRGTPSLRADAGELAEPAWDALRALPPDVQRERITALRTAALSCDGDLLNVLRDGAR
ncbi:ABC transporter permease [Streptomyces scopuliridis]|uniref:ABC transporter permease n=1 Tax=Streptomyces scopuliridis TaxID=452529 RepID=UPI0034249704